MSEVAGSCPKGHNLVEVPNSSQGGKKLGCVLWLPHKVEIKEEDIASKMVCEACCKIVLEVNRKTVDYIMQLNSQPSPDENSFAVPKASFKLKLLKKSSDTKKSVKVLSKLGKQKMNKNLVKKDYNEVPSTLTTPKNTKNQKKSVVKDKKEKTSTLKGATKFGHSLDASKKSKFLFTCKLCKSSFDSKSLLTAHLESQCVKKLKKTIPVPETPQTILSIPSTSSKTLPGPSSISVATTSQNSTKNFHDYKPVADNYTSLAFDRTVLPTVVQEINNANDRLASSSSDRFGAPPTDEHMESTPIGYVLTDEPSMPMLASFLELVVKNQNPPNKIDEE